jgi:hypothetical protein
MAYSKRSYVRWLGYGVLEGALSGGRSYLWARVVPDLTVVGMEPSPLIRGTTLRSLCYRSCYRSRLPAATGLLPVSAKAGVARRHCFAPLRAFSCVCTVSQ